MSAGFVVWFTGLCGAGKSTLARDALGRAPRARRPRRGARRRRGPHPPLQGPRLLARGSRHQRPPHRLRGQARRPLRRLRHDRGDQPLPRRPRRAARPDRAISSRSTASARSPRSPSATPRASTRRPWPGRSSTSPASTIPTKRPESPEVIGPHRSRVEGGEPRADPRRSWRSWGSSRGRAAASAGRARSPRTAASWSIASSRAAPTRPRRDLPAIDLDERAEGDLEMIASGAFSPAQRLHGLEGLPPGGPRDAPREWLAVAAAHHPRRLARGHRAASPRAPASRSGAERRRARRHDGCRRRLEPRQGCSRRARCTAPPTASTPAWPTSTRAARSTSAERSRCSSAPQRLSSPSTAAILGPRAPSSSSAASAASSASRRGTPCTAPTSTSPRPRWRRSTAS